MVYIYISRFLFTQLEGNEKQQIGETPPAGGTFSGTGNRLTEVASNFSDDDLAKAIAASMGYSNQAPRDAHMGKYLF